MKIPLSVRARYDAIRHNYVRLGVLVDEMIRAKKSSRWHYESRVKEAESYVLKLETGREKFPGRPEDMFGCTLVVENHSKIEEAAQLITSLFKEQYRRPENPRSTSLPSHSFAFDDLRLYVSWHDDDSLPPTGLEGVLFEAQIKTFLQHAWGIATHDLVYKSDSISWGTSRVAHQVKAMLENAELSISEAKKLTDCALLARDDRETRDVTAVISEIRARWPDPDFLPKQLVRLAQNVLDLARTFRLQPVDIWSAVDAASAAGRGAKLMNVSPYSAILEALVVARGAPLFQPLQHPNNRRHVFVPAEVELPSLPPLAMTWIIAPTS